jgi:hypothetical protein
MPTRNRITFRNWRCPRPLHIISAVMVGSLVAGLDFRVAPERLNLRALLPLRRALPVAGAAGPWLS